MKSLASGEICSKTVSSKLYFASRILSAVLWRLSAKKGDIPVNLCMCVCVCVHVYMCVCMYECEQYNRSMWKSTAR